MRDLVQFLVHRRYSAEDDTYLLCAWDILVPRDGPGQDRQDLCSHGAYRLVELVQLTNGLGRRSSSFCNSMDCSLPGSSVNRIFQARILEWLPFPSPGDLSYPGIEPASLVFLALAGRFFTTQCHLGSPASILFSTKQNKMKYWQLSGKLTKEEGQPSLFAHFTARHM